MSAGPVLHVTGGAVACDDGTLADRDVEVADGVVRRVGPRGSLADVAPDEVVDATGRIVAPGYVDLQLNGGWGHDFTSDPGAIGAVAARLPATGVTAFVPTIVTSTSDQRRAALATWRPSAPPSGRPAGAAPLGLHFEGPLISPARAGAHATHLIAAPDEVELDAWRREDGVLIVTLAPEVPGAPATIRALVERGIVVAIGHTACTPDEFRAARAGGATLVTHLFNAMAAFDHRAPGPVGATLADDAVVAGVICDGIHVDPVAVQLAWRALGPNRFLLVTDAMAALGLDATTAGTTTDPASATHRLAGREVVVGPSGVRTAEGVLAGSDLAMDQAVRNLVAFTGCAPAAAIRCATATPADVLGLTDRGRLRPGARADLVVLGGSLQVERTFVGGVSAWRS